MAAGFKHSRTHSQGDVTGKTFNYDVEAGHGTLLAPGDAMRVLTAGASTDGTPIINGSVATTASVTGILFAVNPTFAGEALSETGLPVGVAGSVLVNVDPHALYDVEVTGTPLVVTDVNRNIDTDVTAATQSGGLSISNMAVGTVNDLITAPWKIVAILPSEATPAVFGDRALVRINDSTVSTGTVGI